jgi:hypothetical protein
MKSCTPTRTLLTLLSAGALLLGLTGCGASDDGRAVDVGATARPGPLGALLGSIRTTSGPDGLRFSDGHRTVLVDGADLTLGGLVLDQGGVDGLVAALVDHVKVSLPLDGQVAPVATAAAPTGRYTAARVDDGASVELRGVVDGRRFTFTAWLPAATALPLLDAVEVGSVRPGQLTLALDLARILAPEGRLPDAAALVAQGAAGAGQGDLSAAIAGYEDDDGDGVCEPGDDHGGHGAGEIENETETEHGPENEVETETEHGPENETETETEHGPEDETETEHGPETETEDPADDRGRDRG